MFELADDVGQSDVIYLKVVLDMSVYEMYMKNRPGVLMMV